LNIHNRNPSLGGQNNSNGNVLNKVGRDIMGNAGRDILALGAKKQDSEQLIKN